MDFKRFLKIGLSIAMIILVLRMVDFHTLKDTLFGISPTSLIQFIVIYALGQVLSSYKWWKITQAGKIPSSYLVALRSYYIGMYLNCFGLGTLGGDIARGILVANGEPLKTEGVASVIVDRAHGLAVLAAIGTISIAIFGKADLDPLYDYILILFALLVALGWVFGPKILLAIIPQDYRFREKIESIVKIVPQSPRTVLYITFISATFHLLQIGLHVMMADLVSIPLTWQLALITIPFVNILSTLPISWQGLGVRETSYLFFLSGVITPEAAVAFGTLWLLAVTVTSAIGGIVAVMSGDLKLLSKSDKKKQENLATEFN